MAGWNDIPANMPETDGSVTPDMGGAPTDDLHTLTAPGTPALSPTTQQAFGNVLAYGLPGLGVGFLDTLGQSIGVLSNSSVPNFLKTYAGQGEGSFGDFYSRNQQPLRTGGEIAGMFLPGLAAMKILKTVRLAREAGQLGEVLQSSRALDIMLGNSAELTADEAKISQAAITGAADWGVTAGRTVALPAITSAKRGYYATRALDAARTTVAFEIGNRIAFNASDTFYPADYTFTDQLKWAGIGLAGGVALDLVAAKYAARQLINASIAGFERQAIEYGTVEPTVAAMPSYKALTSAIFRPGQRNLGITQYSNLLADLNDTIKATSSSTLRTNLTQDITNIKGILTKQIEGLGQDAHAILPRTSLNEDQVKLALTALDQNPNSFLWARKISLVPEDGATDFYSSIDATLDKLRRSAAVGQAIAATNPKEAEARNAALAVYENAATQTHYVIENDGRYTVFRNRADNWLDTKGFTSIKRSLYSTTALDRAGQNVLLKNSKLTAKADNQLILHDNFRLEIPAGASPLDYSLSYAMGSKLIDEWKPVEGQHFILTPDVNWRTTEMTLALGEKYPEAKAAIQLGGGFTTFDDAYFHVLNQKFLEFQDLMKTTERAPVSNTALAARLRGAKVNYTPAQVIQRLNLPEPVGGASSPLIETFAHARLQGHTNLYDMFPVVNNGIQPAEYSNLDLLQAHLRETAGITNNKTVIPTQGKLLGQKDIRPLFVAADNTPMLSRADGMIAGLVQAQRDVQLERLANIGAKNSPLVAGTINEILTKGREGGELSGAANQARAVQSLHDGLVSGQGQVVYQDRISEQFPTLKAAQILAQNVDSFVDGYVKQLAAANLTPKVSQLLNPKNKADLLDFNRIEQAYRHGWDIKSIEAGSGSGVGSKFVLNEDSPINKQLIEYYFPDAEEGEITHLPDMSVTARKAGYVPLEVSNSAAETAAAISAMSRQSGRENNALRVALGRNQITIRDFHLPTPELSRDGTWFVRNEVGNVIATYTGGLENSNRARAIADAAKLSENGEIHTAVPLSNVQRDHAMFDDNFFSVVDYSDQIRKTNVGIRGGLARTEIDTGDATIKSMVRSLQQQYLNIGIRARAAIFEPEINYARQAANVTSRDNLGKFNIFDRYVATMFSQTPNSQGGFFGAMYGGIENSLDRALSWLNAYHTELSTNTGNSLGAKAMRAVLRKQSTEEEFRSFKEQLPSWNPLKTTNQWAESTFREKMPWTTRPIMSKLSQVSSTLALRFLDVGTAVNNFAGLLTNTPSVVYAMRRLPTESFETWINRTAAWGTQLKPGIVTFSPMKAMRSSIQAFWRGELNDDFEKAAKMGYWDPEYSSLAQVLTAPTRSPTAAALEEFTRKASYLADNSEIFSRKIAWGMGVKIGRDLHGFTDDRNTYIFARNFVNEMIGNYSPNNKPAMFQGAVGLPLGAFQTYMFNFYRRLYGLVERQDKAGILAQYAAQAALFGGKSVPGFGAWNAFMQADSTGADDFQGRLDRSLAPGVSELLLNGSLSNIPKIFTGLQGNALAFYSRGSVDFTNIPPTILDWNKAPPIQFLASTFAGISASLDNFFANSGFSLQQQEEILARFTTNRFLKSIMEQVAGVKTNQRGGVIDASVHDAMHVIAGLMGTQTSATRRLADAYNRDQAVRLNQEDIRAALNDHTRAIIRGGEFDVSELQGLVHDYIRSGGNPQYLGEWFRNTFTTAMTPEAYARMQELGRSGKLLEFENMLAAIQQNQSPEK